jgi:SmpA/OmlA family protein
MNQAIRRLLPCALVSLLCLALSGCGPKLTPQNLDKVKVGMSTAQVKDLLGEPNRVDTTSLPLLGTVTRYFYRTDSSEVTLVFRNDTLRVKRGSLGAT